MPLKYYEAFGISPSSPAIGDAFRAKKCPFVPGPCTKAFREGLVNGACTLVNPTNNIPVPCCPKRLYGQNYSVLQDVVDVAWGVGIPLVLKDGDIPRSGKFVIPFGQRQGYEIRVPHMQTEGGATKFSVDWILALVDQNHELEGFVAVEVQTIDTTGNYRREFWNLASVYDPEVVANMPMPAPSSSSFNFENVNKRILPQLITKGHILRREALCTKGLFFICPTAVYNRILRRVGVLQDYPIQTGAITFLSYSVDEASTTEPKSLRLDRATTTTTDQLSLAFSSPQNLPPQGGYENAIRRALQVRLSF